MADTNQVEHTQISTSLEVERIDKNLFRSKSLWLPLRARGVFGGYVVSALPDAELAHEILGKSSAKLLSQQRTASTPLSLFTYVPTRNLFSTLLHIQPDYSSASLFM